MVAEKAERIGEPGREETVCWSEDRGWGLSLLHVEKRAQDGESLWAESGEPLHQNMGG